MKEKTQQKNKNSSEKQKKKYEWQISTNTRSTVATLIPTHSANCSIDGNTSFTTEQFNGLNTKNFIKTKIVNKHVPNVINIVWNVYYLILYNTAIRVEKESVYGGKRDESAFVMNIKASKHCEWKYRIVLLLINKYVRIG